MGRARKYHTPEERDKAREQWKKNHYQDNKQRYKDNAYKWAANNPERKKEIEVAARDRNEKRIYIIRSVKRVGEEKWLSMADKEHKSIWAEYKKKIA